MKSEIHSTAEKYLEVSELLGRLDKERFEFDQRKQQALTEHAGLAVKLMETVGKGIRKKAFVIDDKVLIVEFEKGLSVTKIEQDENSRT